MFKPQGRHLLYHVMGVLKLGRNITCFNNVGKNVLL